MWEDLKIEKYAFKKFVDDLGNSNGTLLCNNYQTTRRALVEDILPEIKARESSLTDHGPKHVENVLTNVDQLLGSEGLKKLNSCELYCQCRFLKITT